MSVKNGKKIGFGGFTSGKVRFTRVPEQFFTELIPMIDDLNEWKIILYTLWALDRREGEIRYLRLSEIDHDEALVGSLTKGKNSSENLLQKAIADAEEHQVILTAPLKGSEDRLIFLNTPRSQAVWKSFKQGKWQPGTERYAPVSINTVKPNIFQLYEQHIGALTPLIAEMLKSAEDDYPEEWFEDAFKIAVANNVRKWKYVDAILRSWQERGRDDEDRRDNQTNYKRYIEGEFARFVEH